MNNQLITNWKFILALGASISMVTLAFDSESKDARNALVHMADAVKEIAITARGY